ncbi:DNA translocase FtsK [Stenoxybacter acetivorans]|uniref:DNA translocase FtsK n=1 Tax=Stenoxybacter acetivorans TaxID=422441 RepID=UPI000A0576C5|nr:DNA translocase FtsK [Stenoxybacter acetivorans]
MVNKKNHIKPKNTTSGKVAKSSSPLLIHLMGDALWLIALMLFAYITLALVSFSMSDPAWSRSVTHIDVHNWAGLLGAYTADISYYIFGLSAWWWLIAAAVALYKTQKLFHRNTLETKSYHFGLALIGLCILCLFSPILETQLFNTDLQESLPLGAGGLIGQFAAKTSNHILGRSGSLLIILAIMLIAVSLLLQVSWLILIEKIGAQLEWLWHWLIYRPHRFLTETQNTRETRRLAEQTQTGSADTHAAPAIASSNRKTVAIHTHNSAQTAHLQNDLFDSKHADENPRTKSNAISKNTLKPTHDTPLTNSTHLPDLNLLKSVKPVAATINADQLQQTAARIEAKLHEFGINAEIVSATAGPVITRYEISPGEGVKGSQIVNLGKDLARALSVQSVRVVETIAGKPTMGLELPNTHRQEILLSEILNTDIFQATQDKLTVALGKDIAGIPVIANLAKMPHLLVAGTTGSGKSVGVNGMIASILFKARADEVRFIMIDPKMLELSVYEGIPHLLCPVVTDMTQAAQALNWCVAEMEKRYKLLAHVGVRNIDGFNKKIQAASINTPLLNPFSLNPDEPEPLQTLPFIVVVIDELADLMMVEGKKVEQQIARLAQKARAAGIHLILATQRPSVDVITGLIKANIPTRLSFQVSSKIDSRTILDQMGAENLLGKGDMLFLPPGVPEPVRLHGAFVSDEEVHALVGCLKTQAPAQYIDGLLSGEATRATINQVNPGSGSDELFDQAAAFVLETRKTSISSLQRHLRIGYNRAANLMEALEAAGVVSPVELGGSRRILTGKDD